MTDAARPSSAIVRTWRGITSREETDAYLAYFRETGLRDYRAAPGNRGVTVLQRDVPQGVEWLIVTEWESWDAVRAFAGEDPSVARFYPDDERYFARSTRRLPTTGSLSRIARGGSRPP